MNKCQTEIRLCNIAIFFETQKAHHASLNHRKALKIRAGSAVSSNPSAVEAGREAVTNALERAHTDKATCIFVFATSHYHAEYQSMLAAVSAIGHTKNIAGCSGLGVLTQETEIEGRRAVAVLAVDSELIKATPFLIRNVRGRDDELGDELTAVLPPKTRGKPLLALFPDTYNLNPSLALQSIVNRLGFVPIVGAGPGEDGSVGATFQFCGTTAATNSCSGMLLQGEVQFEIGITQACKPFGAYYTITQANGNQILKLDGRPAVLALEEGLKELQKRSFGLGHGPVFAGIAQKSSGHDPKFIPGMFATLNILGMDETRKTLFVSGEVRENDQLSFMCRDPESASEDLYAMLEQVKFRQPAFGLYFNCCARGVSLYRLPNRDVNAIRERFSNTPLVGFHGNFEIAPAGDVNRVHMYTGALVLVSEKSQS